MPNNQNSNNDYVSTAMNTNSTQLYILAPVFLTETLMQIVAKKTLAKASEYIALINNVGLGLNLTTATAMTARATILQFTKGNENVANADTRSITETTHM
ncbi:hypothetical protein ACFX5K_06240 [Rickettsiales bacterium LUAb2]